MDTKWKNMVKAIKKFIKEYYDCVFGFLLFIIGSFLFFVVLVNRYYFSTWGVWRICLIGNILVQAIVKGEIGSREDIKEFI